MVLRSRSDAFNRRSVRQGNVQRGAAHELDDEAHALHVIAHGFCARSIKLLVTGGRGFSQRLFRHLESILLNHGGFSTLQAHIK